MSACECYFGDDCIGSYVRGPHVARKAVDKHGKPYVCPNCNTDVKPGDLCVDAAGLYCDGGGWSTRRHFVCLDLQIRWQHRVCGMYVPPDGVWDRKKRVCNAEWGGSPKLAEMAQHAFAYSDEPYWRDWLLDYEKTWEWERDEAEQREE